MYIIVLHDVVLLKILLRLLVRPETQAPQAHR